MKRTKAHLIMISLLMLCVFMLNGCTTIKAENLMDGIEANEVSARELDDTFAKAQMKLAVELFKASAQENENALISPLSIQLALAMTANGAGGQTREEMEALLGNGLSIEELNQYLYSYVNSLPSEAKYRLEIANSIWARNDLLVKRDFLQANADYYGAQVYRSAFDNQTEKDINSWVDEQTDGMIDKIIDKIDKDTVMYLINALTFDAEWSKIYKSSDVYDGIFTSASGEKQGVELMRSVESRYIETENAVGFFKNYNGGKYSFVALLPNEDITLEAYINSLESGSLFEALNNEQYASIIATMPKFSYEYSITMNDALKELGMSTAFDEASADFSSLCDLTNGNVYIGDVLHKTFISVDERGTKAGAVTKVEMNAESGEPMDTIYICLDRPFLYMIVDNSTNLPIFIGTVASVK